MTKDLFQVVILAGGLATRLRPITETIPKSLISINGEPFINHQLRLLYGAGIRHVVICAGYLGKMIERHVGDGKNFGMRVQYSYDGDTLLGTAGAIKCALPLLHENFFVLYGDSYLPCDYSSIQETFQKYQTKALMTVFKNDGQWDCSNVEYISGKIVQYKKNDYHPNMHHIDYGVGILTKKAIEHIPDNKCQDLALLYQTLLQKNELVAHEIFERFYEVGSFNGMSELESYLSQKNK